MSIEASLKKISKKTGYSYTNQKDWDEKSGRKDNK
jgi:hypothetical protein